MPLVAKDIKYIAIQGAGGKGASYLGVLSALERLEILPFDKSNKNETSNQLKGISGTSAGSITAVMLALGYTAEEIDSIAIQKAWFQKVLNEAYYKGRYRAYKKTKKDDDEIMGFYKEKSKGKGQKVNFKDKMTLSSSYVRFSDKSLVSLSPIDTISGKSSNKYLFHYFISIVMNNIKEFIEDIETSDIKRRINPFAMNMMREAGLELSRRLSHIADMVEALGVDRPNFFEDMAQDLKKEPNNDVEALWQFIIILIVEYIILPKIAQFLANLGEDQKNGCSKSEYNVRKSQEHWDMFKIYLKLYMGVNVGKNGFNIARLSVNFIDNFIDKIDTVLAFDFKDKQGAIQIEPVTAFFELFTTIGEVSLLLSKENKNYILMQGLKTLVAPVNALLNDGGILGGARARYVFSTFIYFAVEVQYVKDGTNYKPSDFKKREKEGNAIRITKNKTIVNILDKGKLEKYTIDEINNAREYLHIKEKAEGDTDKLIKHFGVSTKVEAEWLFRELRVKVNTITQQGSSAVDRARIICLKEDLLYIEEHFTFEKHKELFGIDLVICAANLTSKTSTYFNHTLTPDFPVGEACALSMSIPGLWKPIAVKYAPSPGKGRKEDGKETTDYEFYRKNYEGWFVDGGIYENLPLHAFNGYEEDTPKIYYTPQELADSIKYFPEKKVFGISYQSSHCLYKEEGNTETEITDKEVDKISMFNFGQKGFLSIFGDILGGLFGYSSKLRAINKDQKYSNCIIKANSGYLGMLDFNIPNHKKNEFCENIVETEKETLAMFGESMNSTQESDKKTKCKKSSK